MTGIIMPLRERDTTTVQTAADAFLSSPRYANPNTRRGYTGVLDRLLAGLGASRPLAEVSGEELAGLLEQLWGQRAPATWNRNRGAVTAWLSWCAANRLPAAIDAQLGEALASRRGNRIYAGGFLHRFDESFQALAGEGKVDLVRRENLRLLRELWAVFFKLSIDRPPILYRVAICSLCREIYHVDEDAAPLDVA